MLNRLLKSLAKSITLMLHLKQAPAELEEDATPNILIEEVFSINIYLFI